jgi:formate-dependent nitrite reductase membrane component NrfD
MSAAAAAVHLATVVFPGRPAPRGLIGGLLAAMTQPLGATPPEKRTVDSVIRADIVLLAVELVLIAVLLIGLVSSSLSQLEASKLLFAGGYATVFWLAVVVVGIVVPIALQMLELTHRIPHTWVPAVLVLVGGYALRWVLVNAGQASEIVSTAARM